MSLLIRAGICLSATLYCLLLPGFVIAEGDEKEFPQWEKLEPELQQKVLHNLIEQKDYQALINVYNSSTTLRKVIEADPVLRDTVNGIKELKSDLSGLFTKSGPSYTPIDITQATPIIKSTLEKVPALSNENSFVFDHLAKFTLERLQKYVTDLRIPNQKKQVLELTGQSITPDYLPAFDAMLANIKEKEGIKYVASGILGLSKNPRIDTHLILSRLKPLVDWVTSLPKEPLGSDDVYGAFLNILERSTVDQDTIQYFKEHKDDRGWQSTRHLKRGWRNLSNDPRFQ